MADTYVVTGHCAQFDTVTDAGHQRVMFYRGQTVPADAKPGQIEHNLSVGLIEKVGGSQDVGVDSAGAVVADTERVGADGDPGEQFDAANATTGEQAESRLPERTSTEDAGEALATKRAAARGKLPTDGSPPKSSHGQDVWVEYHVAQGGSYDDLAGQDKQALIDLAKSRQQ
ncbi:hypothetical protein [Micromonospora sp. NBC_00421]|uniref:hypothetical protein n=1 Tax=Micromonospora sp. NBC_00421 TaxID=2975976 RepID=UPI002E1FB9EE